MSQYGDRAFVDWIAGSLLPALPGEGSLMTPCVSGAYREPIEWVLTGLAVSPSSNNDFYVDAYVCPLFVPAPAYLVFNYSQRVWGRNRQTFSIPDADSADEVVEEVVEAWTTQAADAFLARRGSLEGILQYIERYRREAPNPGPSIAHAVKAGACHILLDDLPEARRELLSLLDRDETPRNREDQLLARDILQKLSLGRDQALDRITEFRDASMAAQIFALGGRQPA